MALFAKDFLGIDLGAAHFDCAVLTKKGKVIQLKDYFTVKKEALGEEKAADHPKIMKEFERRNLKNARATIAIPDRNFLVISFKLPKLPAREKEIAVRAEIEQKIPFGIDECAFDIIRLNAKESAENDYVAFCTRMSDVSRAFDKVSSFNLLPARMITEMIANLNCAQFNDYLNEKDVSTLLIDTGASHVGFTLVTNNLPWLTFSLSVKDAYVASTTGENSGPDQFLGEQIHEIGKIISSFEEKSVMAPLTKILLFGKSPLAETALEKLPTVTHLPIEKVNPLKNIEVPDAVRAKNPDAYISSVAIGLALTAFPSKEVKRNA